MSNSAKKALLFNNLEGLLNSDFQRELLKASLDNLFDGSNKLRFNNFAFSMRELSRHILHSRAPDSDLTSCMWYVEPKEKGQTKITRKQRIQYIIFGGLNPDFVESLDLDIPQRISDLLDSISLLSKFTHVEEETFNVQEPEIDELITNVVESFIELLNKIEECRDSVLEEVESKITSRVYNYISQETFNNIDILSTHHHVEHSEVEECKLERIDANNIIVSIKGYLEVVQDYGSSSDRESGEGATINSTFPFKGTVRISAHKIPNDFEIEIDELEVDTDSWYE